MYVTHKTRTFTMAINYNCSRANYGVRAEMCDNKLMRKIPQEGVEPVVHPSHCVSEAFLIHSRWQSVSGSDRWESGEGGRARHGAPPRHFQ